MSYYRKKPIPIEARQYTGDNFPELRDWSEGRMWFDKGDYVIKGAHGEFYPCRKDIFEETYERI